MQTRARVVAILVLALASCRESWTQTPGPDAALIDAGGLPQDDLVPAVGTPGDLDIATWNIENFPRQAATAELVADLIASLELDLVAVQEIASVSAFESVLARLPDHDSVLSSHTYGNGSYQKIGFIYHRDVLQAVDQQLLFDGDGYEFPRPPLEVRFRTAPGTGVDLEMVIIALHLKAGTGDNDANRRRLAMAALDDHVRDLVAGAADNVIVLGDFNEELDTTVGQTVWQPMVAAPELYAVHTELLSEAGEASFLPGERLLDHIVSTVALADEFAGEAAEIVHLERQITQYEGTVSDHVPVITRMPIFSAGVARGASGEARGASGEAPGRAP